MAPPANCNAPNLTRCLLDQSSGSGVSNDSRIDLISEVIYSYFHFLAVSNLPNIPPQDVNFLETQGCLRVPTRTLLDEFFHQYFLHVHPLLPLINEGEFWVMYSHGMARGNAHSGRFSLLVFQAILFASCNFVSKSTIRALGFSNIRTARASLYRRAKLLHDLESESSPLALAQACLLLSFWSPSSTRNPNTSWLSLATQHAKSADAHHYAAMPPFSASTHPLQHRKQNILKRIWWCCIIRDRCLGLLMRRPLQITRAHFNFDTNPPLGSLDLADELETSRVYDATTKRSLAGILSQLVELYVVLTDILMLVFPPDDTPGWGRELMSGDAGQVTECKKALRRWYKDATLRFPISRTGTSSGNVKVGEKSQYRHDSCILYANLMYMYYHSARVVLGHYEILHVAVLHAVPEINNIGLRDPSIIHENRYELQDAASGVTECLKELIHLKLARWLPISAVACTALPLLLNIVDVKLSSLAKSSTLDAAATAGSKQHKLNILIEAMRTYQPQYDGVDWVSEIVRHVVNLAQIDGPAFHTPVATPLINDWTDILAMQPSSYLRLALALDLSLSKGRLPEDGDFPVSLRGLFVGGFSPLRALVETNRSADETLKAYPGVGHDTTCQGSSQEQDCFRAPHAPPRHWSDLYLATAERGTNGESRDCFEPQVQNVVVTNSRGHPSEAIEGLVYEGSDTLSAEDSQSTASGHEKLYIDGPMPDISAEWIESLWDEVGDVEDKSDRDTARVLLEALKEGDLAECVV